MLDLWPKNLTTCKVCGQCMLEVKHYVLLGDVCCPVVEGAD